MRITRTVAAVAIATLTATSSMAQMAPGEPETIIVPTEPAAPRDSFENAMIPILGVLLLIWLASQGGDSGPPEVPPA